MKEAGIFAAIALFAIGMILTPLAGGKVHGEKGQGSVVDGIQAQGQASQPRLGR